MGLAVAFGPNRHFHDDALVTVATVLVVFDVDGSRIAGDGNCGGARLLGATAGSDELYVF